MVDEQAYDRVCRAIYRRKYPTDKHNQEASYETTSTANSVFAAIERDEPMTLEELVKDFVTKAHATLNIGSHEDNLEFLIDMVNSYYPEEEPV